MKSGKREMILKAGLILCDICLAGSVILLILPSTSPNGRTAMIGTAIVGLLTSLSFLHQLRQK